MEKAQASVIDSVLALPNAIDPLYDQHAVANEF
jgi:hypothetical protein